MHGMFRFLTATVFLFSSMRVAGQSPDLFRLFYFNPYIFNAAYCGNSDYAEIELIHRQQWMNFNSAPAASGFVFQYPTQKRVSLGLNFFTQEAVALRTSSIMASFAYRVPLSANQFLNFEIGRASCR